MLNVSIAHVCFFCAMLVLNCAAVAVGQGSKYGQFAPEDTYENGSKLAYYGSENEWSHRMFTADRADRFYRRRGQRQLLAIVDGQAEEVVQWCQERLANDPNDLESRFNLAAAWCALDDPQQAWSVAHKAIGRGLPVERFVAGLRELFTPLTHSEPFRQYVAEHPVNLIHGPLLGDMTDHGVRVWLRTAQEGSVSVRAFRTGEDSPIQTATGQTEASGDFTAVVQLSGLTADTEYEYDVLVDGVPASNNRRRTLRTYPQPGSNGKLRIGFDGGAGFTPRHESIWNTIADRQMNAFLLLGDNVYIDLPEAPGPLHRYTYYRRQSRPEFRRLTATTPIYAIWDDHDCGIDDVWMGPYRDKPHWKRPTLDLFRENWNNPSYGGKDWPGCWYQFSIANVDLFLLDGRFYRTNPYGEQPTMLGPAQKEWLLDGLRNSRAEFKLLVSPVAWAPEAKPGSRDTWDGFSAEREEIFSWIESNRVEGVVLVSADRHRSDAWKIVRPAGYDLHELPFDQSSSSRVFRRRALLLQ